MTDQLYLAEEVYVCVTENHGVFLDLKRDKYSAVLFSAEQMSDLPASGVPGSVTKVVSAQRDELIAAGLLTTDPAKGRPLECSTAERAREHIFGLDDNRAFGLTGESAAGLKITIGEIWDFFSASWKAARDLSHRHIHQIVENVRRRKAKAATQPLDLEKARRLTAVYRRLRPWYPRKYLCLYDSLALVEFMARRNVYPVWVFAVQAQPFGAHCWVQNGRLLLNEGTEYAGQFTPIMAI
jgi:hypothetical protein